MDDIKISNYLMKKIRKFADDRIYKSSTLYNMRGETRVNKIIEDIITGAMGEYCVYQIIKDMKRPCTKPDLKIYEARKKSFAADLFSGDVKIHVKSQSVNSAEKYGYSWLCQRSDKLYSEPTDSDLFAFCVVDLEKSLVTFLGFCKATDVKSCGLWSQCRVPRYRHTKVALYLEQFDRFDIIKYKLD